MAVAGRSEWTVVLAICTGDIPQQSCFSCDLGEMQGLGPRRSGKQKSFPCSLAVTIVFHALSALMFCFSLSWFHSSGPTSSFLGFLLCTSFSLSSPSPSYSSHSIRFSIPSLFLFLATSVGTLLLMLVTEGLSQFFCGQADPKHFMCCVPRCWFHIAALVASISIFLC